MKPNVQQLSAAQRKAILDQAAAEAIARGGRRRDWKDRLAFTESGWPLHRFDTIIEYKTPRRKNWAFWKGDWDRTYEKVAVDQFGNVTVKPYTWVEPPV